MIKKIRSWLRLIKIYLTLRRETKKWRKYCKQHLIQTASGSYLDNLAYMHGFERKNGETDNHLRARLRGEITGKGGGSD